MNDQTKPVTLEETIALLEEALEATHDGILILDLNRRIVRYNRQFLRMFGLTAADLDRRGTDAIVSALSDQLEDAGVLLASSQGLWVDLSLDVLDTLRFKDGRIYQRFIAPHRIDGRIIGRVASYRDVTETVCTKEALDEQRAFLEKAQEIARLGSWVSELDGSDRLSWSAETYKIFGVQRQTFDCTSTSFFGFVYANDIEVVRTAMQTAIAGGAAYDIEHRIVRTNGDVRWVHEKADVVRNADGAALRMVGTVQDITDRRLLEEQLRQSQKLEAIGRLAGGVAHDLNNALTAIIGYAELSLNALADGHVARPDVQEIRRAAGRAESVTRQLLAFSRKQMLEPRVFSLSDSVANLGRLLERVLGAQIASKTVAPRDLPPIYGDPGQIEQAILNIAVNARDAMGDGGRLTLAVSVVDVDEPFAHAHQPMPAGRYVELRIADTGCGMSPDTQAHMFEPFFTTKEIGKGTGLGLAMVYGTVKQSGGFIFVDSEVGHGTTFRLYFPPAAGHEIAPQPIATPADPTAARVLVAEDETPVRNLVVTALRRQGYEVLHASSAAEALRIAATEERPIDVLLTDASMPGMGGLELARTLLRERPNMQVVVMSGYTEDTLNLSGLGSPAILLPKPFTPRELQQKIAESLSDRRREHPSS